METYLYYSFYETETDPYTRNIWGHHFEQEIAHLHKAVELLGKYEGKEWQTVIPDGEFPDLLDFHRTKDYVREVLAEQVTLTAHDEEFVEVDALDPNDRFFAWNSHVNHRVDEVPSHLVIRTIQERDGEDYRVEDAPSPIHELQDRKTDNTKIGRVQGAEFDTQYDESQQ